MFIYFARDEWSTARYIMTFDPNELDHIPYWDIHIFNVHPNDAGFAAALAVQSGPNAAINWFAREGHNPERRAWWWREWDGVGMYEPSAPYRPRILSYPIPPWEPLSGGNRISSAGDDTWELTRKYCFGEPADATTKSSQSKKDD